MTYPTFPNFDDAAGSYTPTHLFAGSTPAPVTREVIVASGENLSQYAVVALNSAGKAVAVNPAASDGTQNAVGILCYAVDASSADAAGNIYVMGNFAHDALVWPAAWDTYAERVAAFARTGIVIGKLVGAS